MKSLVFSLTAAFLLLSAFGTKMEKVETLSNDLSEIRSYPIVGTNQTLFYNHEKEITAPAPGEAFYGQNAHYSGHSPSYQDNGDGTITDLVTGLMWTQSPDIDGDGDIDADDKLTYRKARKTADKIKAGGYEDWRLPSIKELYSLILFSGNDPQPNDVSKDGLKPFIDTEYFDFAYGDLDAGERIIDAQFASSNSYVDGQLLFGVNFADGRIKGYGLKMPRSGKEKTFYIYYVRGNTNYGKNDFQENQDGTITDQATGLMWMVEDSPSGMDWETALHYAENSEFAGYTDWRLPDVKELQSIVDYTRSPGTTQSAAIDPLFSSTEIINEAGQKDYPFYWSSTTHAKASGKNSGGAAAYVSFGRGLGNMSGAMMAPPSQGGRNGMPPPRNGQRAGIPPPPRSGGQMGPRTNNNQQANNWIDVHGAGSQRSDPKSGNPASYASGHGPQGDAIHINNHVRLVRNID